MNEHNKNSIYIGGVTGCDCASIPTITDAASHSAANTTNGHGFMAEDAQTLIDNFRLKNASVVGDDNTKNGADRLSDGVYYQTKFYNSGKGCVNACFQDNNGDYRYINDDGSPMPVEVPRDMYDDALDAMSQKIAEGKVPGVTDPADAAKYVKVSDLTYENARNLCIPFTKESIIYDIANSLLFAFITALIGGVTAFLAELRHSRSPKTALFASFRTGFGIFGTSVFVRVLCAQFARTELFHNIMVFTLDKDGTLASIAQFFDKYLRGTGGNQYSSLSGAIGRSPKTIKAGLFMFLLSLVIFILPKLIQLICGKLDIKAFGKRTAEIIASKFGALLTMLSVSILLLDFTAVTGTAAAAVCLASAVLGGMLGRYLLNRMTNHT